MSEKNPLERFLFTDEPLWDLNHDHLALQPFSSMVADAVLSKTFTDLKRALRSIA